MSRCTRSLDVPYRVRFGVLRRELRRVMPHVWFPVVSGSDIIVECLSADEMDRVLAWLAMNYPEVQVR